MRRLLVKATQCITRPMLHAAVFLFGLQVSQAAGVAVQSPEAATAAARQSWRSCLHQHAISYATGTAEADVIFEASVAKCSTQEQRFMEAHRVEAQSRNIKLEPSFILEFTKNLRDVMRPGVIAAVLDHRLKLGR